VEPPVYVNFYDKAVISEQDILEATEATLMNAKTSTN